MRTGSYSVAKAFVERRSKRLKNDETDGNVLRYHGHIIARRDGDGSISATLAGWNTVTTRLRVNQLADIIGRSVHVLQRDHIPYVYDSRDRGNGEREISSQDWIYIGRELAE